MLTIYLDQNKWIDLARARLKRDGESRFRDVLELALAAVDRGLVSFPLSAIHYIEVYNTRSARRRQDLADTMMALARPPRETRPDTIAVLPRVFEMEIDRALQIRFARPVVPREYVVFGRGWQHALGYPDFDLFSSTAAGHLPSVVRLGLEKDAEERILSGPSIDFPIPSIDTASFRKPDEQYVERENRLVAEFRELAFSKDERDRRLLDGILKDIVGPLTESLSRAKIPIDEFVGLGRDGLHAFLHDVPSCDVDYELHRIRHDNPQLPRKLGDLDDLAFLSFALVYCDVVVTERFWKDRVSRSRLDQRYNVKVLSNLEDLIPILMERTT